MVPDSKVRRTYSDIGERIATYLLLGLLGLLVAREVFGATLPLDSVSYAVVVGGLFLGSQLVRPSVGTWSSDDRTGITARQAKLAVAVLVVLGTVLRLYALGRPSFWFDEAITTNAALGLLEHGRPVFPSGVAYWRAITHTLLVAGSMAVFGTSEWAARLPSVVAGVATIPVVYWLGREVGNRRVGIVAAAVLTLLTWEIAWSRQARMYQLLQLSYAAALLGLARVDRTGLGHRATLALLVGGTLLAALTHRIGLVLVPLAVGYLLVHQWHEGAALDRRSWAVVAGVLVLAAALELLGTGPLAATRTVLGTDIDHLDRYTRVTQSMLPVAALLGVVGMGASARYWKHGLLLAVALVPPAWILVFHTELFGMRYLYFGVPVLAVYLGLLVEVGVEQVEALVRWLGDARGVIEEHLDGATDLVPTNITASYLPVILVLVVLSPSLTVVPQAGYDLGPNAPQPDFEAAYSYVDDQARADDVLVVGWTAPALYYHGDVDYWLAHDLTSAGSGWTADDGVEVYSGAVPVTDDAELRAVIACNQRGWVVIDRIVYRKLSDETFAKISNLTRHDAGADGMYVYSWSGSGECPEDAEPPTSRPTEALLSEPQPNRGWS